MTCDVMLGEDGEDAANTGLSLTKAESPGYFRAVRHGQPIVAHDAVRHEATREFAESYLIPTGVGSVLDAPVWFAGRQIGMFSLAHHGAPRAWEPETVEFASTIASLIGVLQDTVRRVESERALEEERTRTQTVMRRTPIAQAVWDPHDGLVFANPATVALFRLAGEAAMKGKGPLDLSPPVQADGTSSAELSSAHVDRCMAEGTTSFEWIFRRADGTDFPAAVTLVRLSDSGAQRLSTIIDLTEQKAAEAAIIDARDAIGRERAIMDSLINSIPDLIFYKNTDGVYLGCNGAFAALVGRQAKDVVGKTDFDLFPHAVAEFFRVNDERMLRELEKTSNEEWVEYPDGRRVLLDTLKSPFWDGDGVLIGMLGISRDITERKRVEAALEHANFLSDQALDLTKAGYWHVPLDGSGWFNSSERACRVFGDIPREGYRYRVMEEWFVNVEAGDKAASVLTMENFSAAAEGRIPVYDSIYAYKRPVDGRVIWIHALGHVVKDAAGTPTDMYGVTVDITDTRLADEALRAAPASDGRARKTGSKVRDDA